MKRLLALAGALGLIALALFVRSAVSDSSDGSDRPPSESSGGRGVVCALELRDVCGDAFDAATVEAPAATLARYEDGGDRPASWLTTRAWAEVAIAAHPDETLTVEPVGAGSPILFAVWADRASLLEPDVCTGGVTLRCLGEHAGERFADLGATAPEKIRIGVAGLDTTTGLNAAGAAATAYFGDDQFAANDFDAPFRAWLTAVLAEAGRSSDPFTAMLTRGTGSATAVVGLAVDLEPAWSRSARRDEILLVDTGARADLVVVTTGEGPGTELLRSVLRERGWLIDAGDADGLATKPGVLAALRTLAEEVTS